MTVAQSGGLSRVEPDLERGAHLQLGLQEGEHRPRRGCGQRPAGENRGAPETGETTTAASRNFGFDGRRGLTRQSNLVGIPRPSATGPPPPRQRPPVAAVRGGMLAGAGGGGGWVLPGRPRSGRHLKGCKFYIEKIYFRWISTFLGNENYVHR
jgi:hypothetical protein